MQVATHTGSLRVAVLILAILLLGLIPAKPALADQACSNQCWQDYDNCFCGDYWSCASCDEARDNCLSWCDSCPRVNKDWTTTTITDTAGPLPLICLSNGYFYQKYTRVTRVDHYQQILKCDYSLTTNLLGTSSTNKTCYKYKPTQGGSCIPNPNLPPIQNLCII
jgi:hypothetical protein